MELTKADKTVLYVSTEPYDPDLLPEQYSEGLKAKLDVFDELAKMYVRSHRPKNTDTAYKQDWDAWTRFCSAEGIPTTAVRVGTLVAFVDHLWQRPVERPGAKEGALTSPATIDRRLSGVVVTARERYGLILESDIAAPARELLKRLTKKMEDAGERRGIGEAPAMLIPHIQAICTTLEDTHYGLRAKAIVTLAFAIAGREHEIAALRSRDIVLTENGLEVNVRVSKTKTRKVAVPYANRPAICPVRAWTRYSEAFALDDPDAHAFQQLDPRTLTPTGNGLTPAHVGALITAAGEKAALSVKLTGHSPRRGLATEARRAKRDRKVIAQQGGWVDGSKAMERYFEDSDRWEDNALIGVM